VGTIDVRYLGLKVQSSLIGGYDWCALLGAESTKQSDWWGLIGVHYLGLKVQSSLIGGV